MDKNLFQVVVSVFIFNSQGEVLLLKRSMTEDVFPGKWGIPGGKLDNTDLSIEQGLAREVEEEVGVKIKDITPIVNEIKVSGDKNKLYIMYKASYVSGEPKPKEEVEKVAWLSADKLPSEEDFTPATYPVLKNLL